MHPICSTPPVYFWVSAFVSYFLHPFLSAQDATGTNREGEGGAAQLGGEGGFSCYCWYLCSMGLVIFLQKRLFDLQVQFQCRAGALGIIPSQGPGKVTTKAKFLFYKSLSSVLASNVKALGKELHTLCSSIPGHCTPG